MRASMRRMRIDVAAGPSPVALFPPGQPDLEFLQNGVAAAGAVPGRFVPSRRCMTARVDISAWARRRERKPRWWPPWWKKFPHRETHSLVLTPSLDRRTHSPHRSCSTQTQIENDEEAQEWREEQARTRARSSCALRVVGHVGAEG